MAKNTRRTKQTARFAAARTGYSKPMYNPGWILIALILASLGLYALAAGFVAQFYGFGPSYSLPGYFIGLILMMLAKIAKMKACLSS